MKTYLSTGLLLKQTVETSDEKNNSELNITQLLDLQLKASVPMGIRPTTQVAICHALFGRPKYNK